MTKDIEGAIRKILEKLVKPGCADRTIDSALSAILCLNAKLGGIGDCDVCWTSSWMTVPKGTPNAQQVKGKDEWVLCQMCEADRKIIKLATKSELNEKEVEKVLSEIETPIEESLLEFVQTKNKAIVRLKPKWTTLISKAICSHFSKQIKYPEKNRLPLELQHCVMEIHRQQKDLTPLFNEIRNQTIDEVRKLNEEGVCSA